jgi:hypothetical protein
MVSTLEMADALTKLPVEKGVTDAEFSQKLLKEHPVYQPILILRQASHN